MRNVLLVAFLSVWGCSPNPEITGPTSRCEAELFNSYNPKVLQQCVQACMKCDHGTPTSCTTSCTLKGAR